jgi:hypothetical protein
VETVRDYLGSYWGPDYGVVKVQKLTGFIRGKIEYRVVYGRSTIQPDGSQTFGTTVSCDVVIDPFAGTARAGGPPLR